MKKIQNRSEYEALIAQGKPVLLDFYADWCGPCQVLLPTLETLSSEYDQDVIIAKANVDQVGDLAAEFGVRSIPALFFLENGKVVERLVGVQSAPALRSKLDTFKKVA